VGPEVVFTGIFVIVVKKNLTKELQDFNELLKH
jgi:hypothetical protein